MEKENINTENKNTLANGIYILDKEYACVSLSRAKEDNTALGVVLVTDYASIFIDKSEPEGMNWEEAKQYAISRKFRGRSMHFPNTHEGQELAFNHAEINKAMELIGGNAISADWYWTNRESSSYYAFIYGGYCGNVLSYTKSFTASVRPVADFSE